MGIELGLELGSPISCVDEHQENRITISETWDLNRRSDFPKSSTTKIWIRDSNIKLCRWESVSVDSTTEIKGQNLNRLVVCTHSNIRPQANSLRTPALSAHRQNDSKRHTRTHEDGTKPDNHERWCQHLCKKEGILKCTSSRRTSWIQVSWMHFA